MIPIRTSVYRASFRMRLSNMYTFIFWYQTIRVFHMYVEIVILHMTHNSCYHTLTYVFVFLWLYCDYHLYSKKKNNLWTNFYLKFNFKNFHTINVQHCWLNNIVQMKIGLVVIGYANMDFTHAFHNRNVVHVSRDVCSFYMWKILHYLCKKRIVW